MARDKKNAKSKNQSKGNGSNEAKRESSSANTSSLSGIISESKQRIEGVKVDTSKRRVGRPRKEASENKNSESLDSGKGPISSDNRVEQPTAVKPEEPKVDITPYLVMPLKVASLYPANRADIPELALSDEEALACAQAIQAILDVYTPDIAQADPKTAALIQACSTFGAIGFTKYMIYLQKKPQVKKNDVQKSEAPKQNEQNQMTPDQVFETHNVGARPA